jgi:DUF4097 and DUF4098 domain-containing protein YvlB
MIYQKLKWAGILMVIAPLTTFAGQSVDERWNVDANVAVSIENIAGEIVIEGWDKDEAHLTGILGDSVRELDVDANASSLHISVQNHNQRNIDATKLRLMVPSRADIDAEGVSADITVNGLNNDKLTASSVSGEVEVNVSSEWISIESVSGDVDFAGSTSRITAESVSGDVNLSGVSGEIAATTVSGDMELQAGSITSAKFETVSGDIVTACEIADNGRLTAESMSGDVTIVLPSNQAGLFKAQSFSGRISTDFGSVEKAKHGPGSHLKYLSGKSGAEVRIESFSGNIRIKQD